MPEDRADPHPEAGKDMGLYLFIYLLIARRAGLSIQHLPNKLEEHKGQTIDLEPTPVGRNRVYW